MSNLRADVIMIPKYRRKVFYGRLRRQIGVILRDLCRQRGVELVEGHAMPDHVHLCLSIPPKYSVAYVIGFLKGKSAVRIHRELLKERRMTGCTSGQRATVSARLGWMRPECGSTSETRRTGASPRGVEPRVTLRPRRGLPNPTPPTGATTRKRPPRGVCLIPRPLAVVDYGVPFSVLVLDRLVVITPS